MPHGRSCRDDAIAPVNLHHTTVNDRVSSSNFAAQTMSCESTQATQAVTHACMHALLAMQQQRCCGCCPVADVANCMIAMRPPFGNVGDVGEATWEHIHQRMKHRCGSAEG